MNHNTPVRTDGFAKPQPRFYTPQPALVKPSPMAFRSTGFVSKRNRPLHHTSNVPETPIKRRAPLTESPTKNIFQTPVKSSSPPVGPGNDENVFMTPEPRVRNPFAHLIQHATGLESNIFSPSITPVKQGPTDNQRVLPLSQLPIHSPDSNSQFLHSSKARFIGRDYLKCLRASAPLPVTNDPSLNGDYFKWNFNIVQALGGGNFAEAYRVHDKRDGRQYAVKKTKQPYSGQRDRLQKFEEVEILWALKGTTRCVQVSEVWEQFGFLYIKMELCENGSLQDYMEEHCQSSPLQEFQIWHILSELAQAIKEMHDLNIIHLDLKPSNIFLERDSTLKIGDFGMAAFCPVSDAVEREGDRTYIAPEVLDCLYDKPADIFSLGLILLELTANIDLPENGIYWQKLRNNDFSECQFVNRSPTLVDAIRQLLQANPSSRPSAAQILAHPFVTT